VRADEPEGMRETDARRDRIHLSLRTLAIAAALYLVTDLGPTRIFPPICLVLSLALAGLLLVWLVPKALRGGSVAVSALLGPVAAWVGAGILSTAASIDPRLSIEQLLWTAGQAALFLLVCDLLDLGWQPDTFATGLLLSVGVLLLKGLWQVGEWHQSWWQARVPAYPAFLVRLRLYGLADHPNLLAGLLNLALPFAILRLASSSKAVSRAVWAGWLAAADVVLFYTRSRGGWIAACAAVTVTVGWLVWRQVRAHTLSQPQRLAAIRRIGLTALAYVALFVALYVLSEVMSPSEYTRSGGSIASGGGRFSFWQVALEAARSSPWVGTGLRTYSRVYVDVVTLGSADAWVANHAHNLAMNTLAEQGLVGIAALGWLCVAAALVCIRGFRRALAWESANPDGPTPLVVGVGAALAGCLVHMQVDVISTLPTTSIVLVILGAILAHEDQYPTYRRVHFPRFVAVLSAMVVVAGCVLLGRYARAQDAYLRGLVDALGGDWASASQCMRDAVALDPAFTFYREQLAYAEGTALLAETAPNESGLSGVASCYRNVLATQPLWVPNYLNAAWIALQMGDGEQATSLLREAAHATDGWPLASILLAQRLLAQGADDQASALLSKVLERDPAAGDLAACQASALCGRVAASTAARQEPTPWTISVRAMALTDRGLARSALETLASVPITNSYPRPWIERARAHLALGQVREAAYALKLADTLTTRSGFAEDDRHAAMVRAALLQEQGDLTSATKALENVVRPQLLVVPYHYTTFHRFGLPGLLLPGLADLATTRADVDASMALSRLYSLQGREEDAAWAQERANTLAALFAEPALP